MIKGKTMRRLLAAACLLFLQAPVANAQMGQPQLFDAPVPEKWRAPFAQFLSDLRLADAASVGEASKATPYPDPFGGPERMIFRVQHKETCMADQDECLTIIAHVEKGELVSDAMFFAGGKIGYGDVIEEFAGARSPSFGFWSRRGVVSVRLTAKGFAIAFLPPEESK